MNKNRVGAVLITLLCSFSFSLGGEAMLAIGDKAPEFSMLSSNGDTVRLADFAGKSFVVLIFYPGNETPGCTKQLCAVRDDFAAFKEKNAVVFGVNPGNETSHKKFVNNHKFQFPLLVDEERKMAKAYKCDGGLMVKRTVYIVDLKGNVVYAKRGLPPNTEILEAIK